MVWKAVLYWIRLLFLIVSSFRPVLHCGLSTEKPNHKLYWVQSDEVERANEMH